MTFLDLVAHSERMPAHGGRIEGAPPLGGHLSLASLLVRESVQNTWDARDDDRGDSPVLFEILGWDLDSDSLKHLRDLLPVSELGGFARNSESDDSTGTLHPGTAIDHESVEVLVIADRNTVGLCGPTRSGIEWAPVRHGKSLARGQQRFANFIRNSGRATADTGHGDGGAFGIGKAALWMASRCGTVLVHSRTTDEDGEPTERFIGSVHGEHFFADKVEYTGRHFIGRESDDGIIEPLIGSDAARAVRGLPLPSYDCDGRQSDGTTIVIVAPRLPLGWKAEMLRIRDAVRWQVWPKLVPAVRDGTDTPDMQIRLGWNNNPVRLPAPLEDPEIRPYAKALLDCARERISDEDERDMQARCGRPAKLLGQTKFRSAGSSDQNVFHVTAVGPDLRYAAGLAEDDQPDVGDLEAAVDFDRPWGHIALIRREPLLLVRYEKVGGPDVAAEEVGVFLSANDPDVERALTKAEPPAHDDWIYKNVPKDHPRDHRRTFAKRTVEEIRSARRTFLSAFRGLEGAVHGGGERLVSRQISEHLIGGLGGGLPPKKGRSSSVSHSGPSAQLSLVRSEQDGANTVHELDVKIGGIGSQPAEVVLKASGTARDSAGSMEVGGLIAFRWIDSGGNVSDGSSFDTVVVDDERFSLLVTVESNLRIRPKVKVGLSDGP